MKTTMRGVLLTINEEQSQLLDRLMQKYGFMYRFAYKRLRELNTKVGELERILATETSLPLRYAKDAVAKAVQLIKAQNELVKEHLTLWERRKKKTTEKIHRIEKKDPNSRKLRGLRMKLEKQQRKIMGYQQHVDNGTIPSVIFGSRELYLEQFKDGVAREEWRQKWDDARNGRLSAREDRSKKGNALLRVIEKGGAWQLEISLDTIHAAGSTIRYDKLQVPLYIGRKVSKKTGAINGRDYVALLRTAIRNGDPYQVEILRRNGQYHVHITVEEAHANLVTYPVNGWVGMDNNPTLAALCYISKDGNPLAFLNIKEGQLYDARSNKRDWLIGNMAREVVAFARSKGAGLVIEDLKFMNDRDVSTKFNRMAHQFNYRHLATSIEREAAREGVELLKTKPAYTSVIGRLKYQPQYGISIHSSAALVIARRGGLKVFRENIPKQVKRWLIAQGKFNEASYRKHDWGTWSTAKKMIEKTLQEKGGSLVSWLGQRKEVLGN